MFRSFLARSVNFKVYINELNCLHKRNPNISEGAKTNRTKTETYDNILDEEEVVATFRIDSKVTGADALIGFL